MTSLIIIYKIFKLLPIYLLFINLCYTLQSTNINQTSGNVDITESPRVTADQNIGENITNESKTNNKILHLKLPGLEKELDGEKKTSEKQVGDMVHNAMTAIPELYNIDYDVTTVNYGENDDAMDASVIIDDNDASNTKIMNETSGNNASNATSIKVTQDNNESNVTIMKVLPNNGESNAGIMKVTVNNDESSVKLSAVSNNDESNDEIMNLTPDNDESNATTFQYDDLSELQTSIVEELETVTDAQVTIDREVVIRKCCAVDEYFNLASGSCQHTTEKGFFLPAITPLMYNLEHPERVSFKSSSIKECPGSLEPPRIASDISSASYLILENGEVYDQFTQLIYGHVGYCLELVGTEIETAVLTLAFCPQYWDDYIDIVDSASIHEYDGNQIQKDEPFLVRKCCGEFEYFDSVSHKCKDLTNSSFFYDSVQNITFENSDVALQVKSSRLKSCPNGVDAPSAHIVKSNEYRLTYTGEIIDLISGLHYNYSHYCLEAVGGSASELLFMVAICPSSDYVPKCCPKYHYFDEKKLDCLPMQNEDSAAKHILHEFEQDAQSYELKAMQNLLGCKDSKHKNETASEFIIKDGELCSRWFCINKDSYCVDYFGAEGEEYEPMAFYCPQTDIFIKCCPEDEVMSDSGCVYHDGRRSSLLNQLIITKTFRNSFEEEKCKDGNRLLMEDIHTENILWWLSKDGHYLAVKSNIDTQWLERFCIDDFLDDEGKISAVANVCKEDVAHMIPEESHFQNLVRKGSIGKCCPKTLDQVSSYHVNEATQNCELGHFNRSLKYDAHLKHLSFIDEHYHDFPECESKTLGYHAFPLVDGDFDHAILSSQGELRIISKNGKCISRDQRVTDRDFCVEYILSDDGRMLPSAFVCAQAPVHNSIYVEKFILVTILLGISCVCLLLTLISLFTIRVRRGLVTTRKANTLAGRILISFVGSHFIGFLALSLTQYENPINTRSTLGCYILAGMIQFFNLSTFCWNTSICLESLLLTIHINISEWLRYFLHSMWAWGFPFLMTLMMFLMDHYRDELPCGTITPKLAVSDCFMSDDLASLVYFYVPILITLTANVSFLLGAKAMRKHQLKLLEKGKGLTKASTHKAESGTKKGSSKAEIKAKKTSGGQSGMRIHQNHNAKAESIRIVLWTGGTWFLELIGFVFPRYILPYSSTEKWYEYLWYIPTSINALRGVGIFAILVLTPEKRKEISKYVQNLTTQLEPCLKCFGNKDLKRNNTSANTMNFTAKRKRNMSVVTMLSTISSSFYSSNATMKGRRGRGASVVAGKGAAVDVDLSSTNNNNSPKRKLGVIRSVSQLIDRRSSVISTDSNYEDDVALEDYSKMRRKSSLPEPLPKLYEEEIDLEGIGFSSSDIEEIECRTQQEPRMVD